MDKHAPMISMEAAAGAVERTLGGRTLPAAAVPAGQAVGRTLLADQVSTLDLPPFNKSAMDGYAVLDGDERDEYRVLEMVPAGAMPAAKLQPGTAVKVMTGAPVPQGAGRVIMIEHVAVAGETIRVLRRDADANICLHGEDVRRGDVVLRAGTVIRPVDAANLISCGITEVRVARRVRLAALATGDEIVDSPEDLSPGKIMNSNGPLLGALGEAWGLDVVGVGHVGDDPDAITAAVREAAAQADVVVLSGGVSVGDRDFALEAIELAGMTVHFSRVAIKPGKPAVFASPADSSAPPKAVFGLPGNPASVFLTFHLFVLRAAALMSGGVWPIREIPLAMGFDFRRRKTARRYFMPCRLGPGGCVQRVEYHGSAHLHALSRADGFLVVPEGVAELPAGGEVTFLPIALPRGEVAEASDD